MNDRMTITLVYRRRRLANEASQVETRIIKRALHKVFYRHLKHNLKEHTPILGALCEWSTALGNSVNLALRNFY